MRASLWAPIWMIGALALTACGSHKKASNTTPGIAGTVTNEAGAALAGVQVNFQSLSGNSVTDANGSYSLTATGAKMGDFLPVRLLHPDYAGQSASVLLTAATTQKNFVLRAHDLVTTVTLPASANDMPAVVGTTRSDAGTQLHIAAGDLVLPNGTVATGQANVKLSFWHPLEDHNSAPAPLIANWTDNSNFDGLFSYGMADIEIRQGNDLLQVAAGHALTLDFNVPAAMQNMLLGIDANASTAPVLWYADANTAQWTHVGSLTSGALTVDANTGLVTGKLPHLSAWNVDGVMSTNLCVTGKVLDNCGAAESQAILTLWITGGEQIAQTTITTGTDGTFCANLIGSSANSDASHTANFYPWVSALQSPGNAVCNPAGSSKGTFSALCTVNKEGWCTGSDQYTVGASSRGYVGPLQQGATNCGIAQASVPLCGYCAGTSATTQNNECLVANDWGFGALPGGMKSGACTDLGTLRVPWCGAAPNTTDPCAAATAKHQGDPCTKDSECCPNASLICADGLCVPNRD